MTFETVEQYIKRSPDPYKARLQMIWDIGHDYDNCKTNECLRALIYEICEIAKGGLNEFEIK